MSVALDHVTRVVDGVPTIGDVSLTLERGALSVLLGPTLSGKASTMRLLAGLDKPTQGRVLVDRNDVTGLDVRKRFGGDGLSAVHQLSLAHGCREGRRPRWKRGCARRRNC